ncbi:divalent-cation tolerance protein CutA [Qipengyuania sp. 1NDH17]|uniref:Divalent-cation tolerance protein CutA n=1 Tax=Qipengyuania polymorpha TaxID=2867234 RepID=A0ABS7J3R8_9SPHN|nr:divalent-cation tolerance protein CutA [Qipengyuania polymorpha]MBX7458709.1 divalent-cation tolerance protein CutA [Qipengyuania polymorpha]
MSALVYCPFPDAASAREVGQKLLAEGLIGCINIGAPIHSLFEWAGEHGEGEECPALLKTDASLLERAIARLEDLHPYEAPAILGWPCIAGKATAGWLAGLDGGNGSNVQQ